MQVPLVLSYSQSFDLWAANRKVAPRPNTKSRETDFKKAVEVVLLNDYLTSTSPALALLSFLRDSVSPLLAFSSSALIFSAALPAS